MWMRLFIAVLLSACGAPQAKLDLNDEPLVSTKPLNAPVMIGNRGVALLRDGVVYLARVDIPLGIDGEIVEDYDGHAPSTIGAAYARRKLSVDEVPERFQSLIGQTIYAYDGAPCQSVIESMSVELYTDLPDVGFDDVQTAVANITPTVLTAQLSEEGGCYPSLGIASMSPISPDTFFDSFSYDDEQTIVDQMLPIRRDAILVDPISSDDVIVSVEEIEDDCSKPESFKLTVYRFRKNNNRWVKQELFTVNDSDGIVYISNGKEGLIVGTETGVYVKGAFESFMPSRIVTMPPDPNCVVPIRP